MDWINLASVSLGGLIMLIGVHAGAKIGKR
jgi:hypothetical protein